MNPTVTAGEGEGERFVAVAAETLREEVGFRPYHGTLNLRTEIPPVPLTGFVPWDAGDHCDGIRVGKCYAGGVSAAVVEPDVPSYPAEKTELIAPVSLRTFYGLEDGDELAIDTTPNPSGHLTDLEGGSDFGGVVLDLDVAVLEPAIRDDDADEPVERAERLLGRVVGLERPVGVLTGLDTPTVRLAFDRLGYDDADIVVQQCSSDQHSVRSDCLTDCIEALGCSPRETLLVSDRAGCEQTAKQAETSVVHAEGVGRAGGSENDA